MEKIFSRHIPKRGFTMIELLVVLFLTAIMASTAIPTYLDFKRDAQLASIRHFTASLRFAISAKRTQVAIKCGQGEFENPSVFSIAANDITFGGDCEEFQVPNERDRKFLEISANELPIPYNHANGLTNIAECPCESICDTSCNSLGAICYNQKSGNIWAPGAELSCEGSSLADNNFNSDNIMR